MDPARVSFKAMRIYVFTAVDLETDLIKHYGGTKGLAWNGSGFGSNDPGRERDTTNNKPTNFDYLFPIDINRTLTLSLPASGMAAAMLGLLREQLPYTIRAQRPGRSRQLHDDLETTTITGLSALTTTREIVKRITTCLPAGWQATKLLGYMILYKESKTYPQSEIIAIS